MSAVFKREFKSYFTGPIGYAYLAVCLFFQADAFVNMYKAGYPHIDYLFSSGFMIVLISTPLLTMRIMSEEKRQKTDQLLFTSPVSITGVVMGKFFAAFSVFMLSYALTFIYQLILAANANVDWMIYISNIIGVALLGAALIGLGVFISSLTESQIVAAIISFAVALILMKLDVIIGMIGDDARMYINYIVVGLFSVALLVGLGIVVSKWIKGQIVAMVLAVAVCVLLIFLGDIVRFFDIDVVKIIASIYFLGRYSAFMEGVLDYSNMIFFVSFAAIFLFLSVRVLDRKRWA